MPDSLDEFIADYYAWIKALHVFIVMAWMAGMLYLPRLFVYHAGAKPGSELSETLKVMEKRLLFGIMNPAVILVWLLGLILVSRQDPSEIWLQVKLTMVVIMSVMHGLFALWRKNFERDANTRSPRFYRIANEIPAVLLIIIVFMVVVQPF
jgi:putative membrane protein